MKTLITTLLGCLLYFNTIAQNAATSVWTDAFGLQDTVLKIPTIIDNLGNLYVAGSTINGSSGPDIVIKKYDSNGDPVFGLTYSSAGNNRDQATTIAIDNNYNLIVGGFSYVNATNSYDFLVLKYDSAGTLLWTYTYNGTGSAADLVSAIALDGSNIYITGASVGISSLFDFTTIKLNSAGSVQWNNRYNYLGADLPFDIDIIDTNIYVNGGSQSTMTNWDYALLHYSINGAPIDTIRTTGTGVGFDRATQAVTDNQGYIYITGTYATTSNGLDYKTIKFDQLGNVKWIATFDNTAHQDDVANAIAVDYYGNVYVTGKTFNSLGNYDYCTIKYDSLGTTQWTRYYDNKYFDEATSITVDSYNNVYVTGSSSNNANKDFTTIGYGTAGDTLWTKRFNGGFNGNDEATSIIEENGFVYVSGQTQINSTQYKNITIAYGQAKIKEIPDLLSEEKSPNLFYIPNEGQLANDTGAIASDVLYYVPNHFPSIFVNYHGLSYVFKKFTNDSISNDTIHRIDMQFMRGNYLAKANVYPNKETSNHYQNYYLPHCSNGVIDVRGSNMLMAESIYEGIDLYYSSNQTGEKHYWVLAPNANYKAIKIKFNGADSVSTPQGKYTIHSSIGKIEYDSLVAYEIDAVGNIIIGTSQPLRLMLDSSSNSYYFKTFSYNTSNTLVIVAKQKVQQQDVSSTANLVWSTYFGGGGISTLYKSVVSSNEDLFVTGTDNQSFNMFPITTGAFQSSIAGADDITVSKFDKFRNLIFSTYYGGSYADTPRDIMLKEGINSLYITGRTASSTFPIFTKLNALNRSYYGFDDGFIVQLNSTTGYPIWSTFIGSSLRDEGSCLVSKSDGFYLLGFTSGNDFLTQSKTGAYNNATRAGGEDITITEFNTDDNTVWSTLIGGNGTDYARSSVLRSNGNLVISGMSISTNFPTYNPGGGLAFYESANSGSFDIVMLEFDNLGSINWCTYIGSPYDDWAASMNGCVLKSNGNVCIAGLIYGDGLPTLDYNTSNLYQSNFGGGLRDGFYIEFNANNGLLFSTYIGDSDWDEIYGICKDWADNIYFTGTTLSPNFTTINFNNTYYTQSFEGSNNPIGGDAIIGCIDNDLNLIWSTYIGGNGTSNNSGADIGYGLSICGEDFDRLFLIGGTGSSIPKYPCIDPGNGAYFQNGYFSSLPYTPIANGIISEFDISSITGLNKEKIEKKFSIYPNPSTNKIHLPLTKVNNYENYEVNSVNGTVVLRGSITKSESFELDVSSLVSGFYLLRFINNNGTYETYKFEKY